MKKSVIIGLVTSILGVIFIGISLGHSSVQPLYWDHGFKVYSSEKEAPQRERRLGDIKKIDFSVGDSIAIKSGDVGKPTVSYPAKATIKQRGEKLTIRDNRHGSRVAVRIIGFGDFSSDDRNDRQITVTVPKKTTLSQIVGDANNDLSLNQVNVRQVNLSGDADVTVVRSQIKQNLTLQNSGDTFLDRVIAPVVNQSQNDGDITVRNSTFAKGKSHLTTNDGDVVVGHNHFKGLQIESDDGDIVINNNQVQQAEVHTSDGDITGWIKDRKKAFISADTNDGDVYLFGHLRKQYGSLDKGTARYQLLTDDGDVSLH